MGPASKSNLNRQPSRIPTQDRKCERLWTLPNALCCRDLIQALNGCQGPYLLHADLTGAAWIHSPGFNPSGKSIAFGRRKVLQVFDFG
jgi:hypothetical protein